MRTKNWNCDGGYCLSPKGEVRAYPIGGGANVILCRACWAHENRYRRERQKETGRPADWPEVNWMEARPYPP